MAKSGRIPVIDLFAGPGGLGEGFSALSNADGRLVFRVCLSIEKESRAHETLQLRAFFRQFESPDVPDEYYRFLRGELTQELLFAAYPKAATAAKDEAWHAELGVTPSRDINERITSALSATDRWALVGGPPCQSDADAGRDGPVRGSINR